MPRASRLNQPGLHHHVISRGNANQDIFRDDEDYKQYLILLKEALKEDPLSIFNYVLLSDQLHLLVQTKKEGSLSRAMKNVTREYAKYFNKKYNSRGHVFEGRFKSFAIQDDKYFFACSRYIDLLAVRRNIAKDPKEYYWSGHHSLGYGQPGEYQIDFHPLYQSLGNSPQERQLVYRGLIQQYLGEELDLANRKSGILGSREFKKALKAA